MMQDKANPLATVLSAAMLLKYGLGEEDAAKRIEAAVLDTLSRGYRTVDIHSDGNVCAFSIWKNYSLIPFIFLHRRDFHKLSFLIFCLILARENL
jgi:uncharacterized protein YuzE